MLVIIEVRSYRNIFDISWKLNYHDQKLSRFLSTFWQHKKNQYTQSAKIQNENNENKKNMLGSMLN